MCCCVCLGCWCCVSALVLWDHLSIMLERVLTFWYRCGGIVRGSRIAHMRFMSLAVRDALAGF